MPMPVVDLPATSNETKYRMNALVTIPVIALLALVSATVLVWAVRIVLREMNGLGNDEDGAQDQRRTEERKNARIARELEQWRSGE
jgi:hypothetical protein